MINRKNKIPVFCDDPWHPARVPQEGLTALPLASYDWEWMMDVRKWNPESMLSAPFVVFTKSNNLSTADQTAWMTEPMEQIFLDYVRGGGGLLVIHSGTAGYGETRIIKKLFGGVFVQHPEQCPVTIQLREGHPLCNGSVSFTIQDEHYFMAMENSENNVFLITQSSHGEQPGGWSRVEGKGRIVVLTPGHNIEVWRHPSFQTLLTQAISWCSKAK